MKADIVVYDRNKQTALIAEVNESNDYPCPEICSPEELIGE